MSENEIKPVAWRCIWNRAGESAWEQYHDESDPMPEQWDCPPDEVQPLYDQSAIDRMSADALGYKRIADEAAGMLESAEGLIDRLTEERDWAVADAERYRWIRLRIGGRESVEEDFKWEYEGGECLAQEVDAAIDAARAKERQG